MSNELIDRLIRIKDGMTNRADRDAINDACAAIAAAKADTAQEAFIAVIDEEIATARSVGMIGAATVLALGSVKRKALAAISKQDGRG